MERASADQWYRLESKSDGVTLIEEPFIKPFYRCNIWHVAGRDADLLVDSGMGVVSLREHVPLVRRGDKPILCAASHTHFDHIGAHAEFEHRLVHWLEADLLAQPTRANTLAESYVSRDIFTKLPPGDFDPKTYAVPPAPPTRVLEDGDLTELGDRSFEVIHTPGHSPGGIGLWEAETGVFISGDIVYNGELVEDTYHADMDDYMTSMERLLSLPVRVVHGGHFGSFGRARFEAIITAWSRAKGRLG